MKPKTPTAILCALALLCLVFAISACSKEDEVVETPTEIDDNIISEDVEDIETIDEDENADEDGYLAAAIVVGAGTDYPVGGVLSLPNNSEMEKFPAVILIHGSGPNNMDEEINGITVFADIADYLAQNNIAVLRYDKRTFTHGVKFDEEFGADVTVEEEVIEDALLARDLLLQNSRIDPERIYIIGHSLGGMLAPRIVSEGGFAGAVIMAGSPRSLLDIMYDQQMYFADLMGLSDAGRALAQAQIDEAYKIYFGLPIEVYITEMDAHPAADYLAATDKPFLFLQGDKDFQITTEADFNLYKEIVVGLDNSDNFEFILYDDLNHLFIVSTMENPTADDYVAGSKVDPAPLSDIVRWINR